jgi:ABC-2 type transport system permease protein
MVGAFVRMDVVDDFSYPASFLMNEISILVPIIVSFFIGELTVGARRADLFGSDYFTFAVLGLAIASVLQGALSGFGFALQRSQERGTLETLLVEPVPWTVLPLAMNVWRTVMGLVNGAMVLVMGWVLGAQYDLSGIPAFLLVLFLGILASQGIGILSASFLVLAKRSQAIIKLYALAASLLAGAVFSVGQLPWWLRAFSWVIPHTYVITTARAELMDDAGSFAISLGTASWVLVGFTLVIGGGGLYLFKRSLEYARKMGMLSGY